MKRNFIDVTEEYIKNIQRNISKITYEENYRFEKHVDEIKAGVRNPRFIDNSTARENIERIRVLQDRPNPPMKIVDIGVGWETLDSVSGWRLQRANTLINGELYRIVDPLDYQRACGCKEKMQESFERIRLQYKK